MHDFPRKYLIARNAFLVLLLSGGWPESEQYCSVNYSPTKVNVEDYMSQLYIISCFILLEKVSSFRNQIREIPMPT